MEICSTAPTAGGADPLFAAAGLFQAVLNVSLTAIQLWRPLFGLNDEVVDFSLDYLNPAGQRMAGLPEQPGGTLLARFPGTQAAGTFGFYCQVFTTGEPGRFDVNYQHDGFDNYYHIAAQRHEEWLVVSFTDTADHNRTPVEEALRASQAREQIARAEVERQQRELQRLFEQAPVGLATFHGPHCVVQMANPAVLHMWGRTLEQTLDTPLFELLPEAAGQGFEELLAGVMATGVPYVAYELPAFIDRAGRRDTVYWNFVYQPQREADGQVSGVTVVVTDVTEQVLARQQVQELNTELARVNQGLTATVTDRTRLMNSAQAEATGQRQRLHRLIAEAPAMIAVLTGPDHRIELANDGFHQVFGHRPLVGKPYRQAVPELAGQPFFDRLDAVYQTGETYYGVDEPVTLDRTNSGRLEHTYATYTYQATRDARGRVDGVLIFAYDVTQQVLARRERDAQLLQVGELLAQAPVAVGVFAGPDYRVEVCNPGMLAIWGRTAEQALNRPLFEVLPEIRDQGFEELLDEVGRTGVPHVAHEVALRVLHAGQPATVHVNFVYHPLRDPAGRITAIAAVANDVSEQVAARQSVVGANHKLAALNDKLYAANAALADANEELGTANQQLTRANADLDSFAYTASHDLHTPITNLEGLLQALVEQLPPAVRHDAEVHPLLRLMQGAIDRFQLTLTQLTDIIREDNAPAQPAESVDLASLVEGVRLDLNGLVVSTQPQLLVDVAGCPRLTFAPRNLRSIVYNLLSNALKYHDPARKPIVHVRCKSTKKTTVLEIEDNGLGLDESQQARLFGLFQRLHPHVEGNGVGLYNIKKIVENAGGTIAVRSQPGVGTAFTVTLPVPV
ncbi:PAS domain-containing protein [Hymenobacter sp. BT683]|uniref:histidine kinase n=2 Tax=Hymenobacter jeongseonensis TaxID=2791027 RepID=A0ABS0IPF7_9BACT|nr:PAS domain-containing protein [Hymenobacter jeongseonensis]